MNKKHNKEKALMQKQHCAIVDKLKANNEKAISTTPLLANGQQTPDSFVSAQYGDSEKLLNSKVCLIKESKNLFVFNFFFCSLSLKTWSKSKIDYGPRS